MAFGYSSKNWCKTSIFTNHGISGDGLSWSFSWSTELRVPWQALWVCLSCRPYLHGPLSCSLPQMLYEKYLDPLLDYQLLGVSANKAPQKMLGRTWPFHHQNSQGHSFFQDSHQFCPLFSSPSNWLTSLEFAEITRIASHTLSSSRRSTAHSSQAQILPHHK